MGMTRLEMQVEIRDNINRDASGFSASKINNRINWAQDYLSDLHTYEEMRETFTGATVADQRKYGFPPRMKDIFSMTFQDGAGSRKLTYAQARNFDEKIPRPLTVGTGRSEYYVDYGVNFELYRIPDAIYTLILRASIYPTDLSSDSAESDLKRKDNLIISIATVFCFWSLKEVEDASYWGSQLIPPLYEASLTSDHNAEDWTPVTRGFGGSGGETSVRGDWWKSPFVGRRV